MGIESGYVLPGFGHSSGVDAIPEAAVALFEWAANWTICVTGD